MGGFTIISGKEGASPKKPLYLVTITSPDRDTCYLTTTPSYGSASLSYGGNTYLARIIKNDIQAIQASGPQGYDTVPGFTLTLADGDKFLWTNHCLPHGWRGAVVNLTFLEYDVVSGSFSSDAYSLSFIGGNPSHIQKTGQTILECTNAVNFTRLKVPSVPLQYTCPWDFPPDAASRAAALNDPTSIYYQCGYSADQSGGVGNYQSPGVCFTTCGKTRSSPSDPSVGCMARHGNAATTSVAPDGDLAHDKAGHYTARFGGCTFIAPAQYSGRQYVSGQKVFGFNQPNTAIVGSYINWVYGTQWVQGAVLAPCGDSNSLRSEVILCFAPFGPVTVWQVLVNSVMVPFNNPSDPLFLWRFAGGVAVGSNTSPGNNVGAGGRSGCLNGDKYFSNSAYSALSDPHGSMCVIEFVVPAELAAPGSVPTVQALVTSGPMLSATSGGSVSPTAPNLTDSSLYDISTQDSVATGPAANPLSACLDLMCMGNITAAQVDLANWYATAQIAALAVSYQGADGNTYNHPQFKTCLQLPGNNRQTLASVLTALRNSANLMIGPNPTTGLIQAWIKQTLHDQQPSAVPGSNYNTAVDSMPYTASPPTPSSGTPGYLAYLFDETNIEKDSFRITTQKLQATPNTVAISFQDEYNSYQTDSLTEVDPEGYAYSGNQEVNVPVPLMGIPNFDQGSRIANVQLAEALYGNQRNDAGGTLYFEFTTNHRVVHLCGRLGFICGLVWQELSIGLTQPQMIRILELKPDTDGEHWQVKAMWHDDQWYTTAYGQNPTPYQNIPVISPPVRPPYPWRPGQAVWTNSSEALFPNELGFLFSVDITQYPAQVYIQGTIPNNAQPSVDVLAPLMPLQASSGSSGGTIPAGTYSMCFSPNGQTGPVSAFVSAVVPAGTTNTITVSGIQWKGAAPSILPFIGHGPLDMRAADPSTYTSGSPDSNGNPTSFTFTALSPDGAGLPDTNFAKFLVEENTILHGGVWGDTITSVDVTGKQLTFSGANGSWTAGQWNGYILSLYYRPGANPQPGLSQAVLLTTGNVLVTGAAGFQAGDVVVLRAKAQSITATTIGDPNFVNNYNNNTGLTVNGEKGNLIYIIAGTGRGQPPKTIKSNTSTVFTLETPWDILPASDTVYIIMEPTVAYAYFTKAFSGDGTGLAQIAQTPAVTTDEQNLLVTVLAADSQGNVSPFQYQPSREVYVPPQPPDPPVFVTFTSTLTAVTLTPNAQIVSVDATAAGGTITLPPFAEWIGEDIVIMRTDTVSANTVTWQLDSTAGDTIANLGGANTGTLAPGQGIQITATLQ